jgi:sporulation protein YlmC with PRC-barrel domain
MQRRKLWLGTTILRNRVRTSTGEDVGKIEDVIVDHRTERIIYAVLMVEGYPELFVSSRCVICALPFAG